MTRQELADYLADIYSAEGEQLFAKYPSFLVFRHNGNRKWFAVIMDIPRKNLSLPGEGEISVVNATAENDVLEKLIKELRDNYRHDMGTHGANCGQIYNVGACLPWMQYTPRTLDEIIKRWNKYHPEGQVWKP